MRRNMFKRGMAFLVAMTLMMTSLPMNSISFAIDEVSGQDILVEIKVKNSERTESITVVYTGHDDDGNRIPVTLTTSLAKGEDIFAVEGQKITVTINEKVSNGNPFPGMVRYNTTTKNNIDVNSPFEFNAGATMADGGKINLVTSWKRDAYVVKFDSDGGTPVADQSVKLKKTASEPTPPTKVGYNFMAWTYGDSTYDFSQTVVSDMTLLAIWTKEHYTVSFDSRGGSEVTAQSVLFEEQATEPSDPGKSHYSFVKWQLNGSDFLFTTQITDHIELDAVWEADKYLVTFDEKGGSLVDDQLIAYDTLASYADSKLEGHILKGWKLGDDYFEFLKTTITGPIHLVADWKIENYNVTFNENGGTLVEDQVVDYKGTASQPTTTLDHYDFVLWQLNGSEFLFETQITDHISLDALWTPEVYKVTFDENDGSSVDDQDVVYNEKASQPDSNRTGYELLGWKLGDDYFDFENTAITGPIHLVADWKIETYNVTFNENGGTLVEDQVVDYKGTASKASTTLDHYDFVMWQLNGSEFLFETEITDHLNLDALWTPEVYDVTFNSNQGSAVDAQKVTYDTKATVPTVPSRSGYVFVKWQLNGVDYDFNSKVVGSIELDAVWDNNPYAVHFNTNGGSEVASQVLNQGEKATYPEATTKTGYDFVEWHLEGQVYEFDNTVEGNITLDAVWKIKTFVVTFNSNEGSEVPSKTVDYNTAVLEPQEPSRDGYSFIEWMSGSDVYDFNHKITENMTLIAKWEADTNEYLVAFNSNEGSDVLSQTVLEGNLAEQPNTPSKSNYNFVEWRLNGSKYDFATSVYNNITLDALWVRKSTPQPPQPPVTPRPSANPSITLDKKEVELEYGTEALDEFLSYDFTETIKNSSDLNVKWSVEDEEVLSIDENGVVRGLKEGETTITVTHIASGETDTAVVIVFLVGDEITPLGAVKFFAPYVYGYPDTTFRPKNSVTRAEVATMFSKILKLNIEYPGTQKFADVKDNSWYYNYVQAISRTGIFVGDSDGSFRPNDPISRGEMAAVFAKYWKFLNIDVDDSKVESITDLEKDYWANSYIYMMHNAGIVGAFEDGTYQPNTPTLREQVVGMINTLIARPEYHPEQTKYVDIISTYWAFGNIEAATTQFSELTGLPVEEE